MGVGCADRLEKLLGHAVVVEEESDEMARLEGLSKEEVIRELLRAKVRV